MKKFVPLFLCFFALALSTSCEDDISKRQAVFTATMPADDLSSSRPGSIINGIPDGDGFNLNAQWKDGDKIQIFVRQDGKVYQADSPSTVSDISSDGKTCSFELVLPKSVNRDKDYEIIGVTGVDAYIDGDDIIATCALTRVGIDGNGELSLPMWFTCKKGNTQAKFSHLCAYEVLNVNNCSSSTIRFKHRGFEVLTPWYKHIASILLSDGYRVVGQDVQSDVESDEVTIPSGGTGTIVSWYIPVTIIGDVTIDNAKLKAVVNGEEVTALDAMVSYKTQARGNAYYMEVNWDGSYLYYSNDFCPDGNHPHIIDLGLPSGTKWACCNVGANSPDGYGVHFSWGETITKYAYLIYNYKWFYGNDDHNITKYCCNSDYGTVDGRTELEEEDDAAYVNWGPEWRMPSLSQFSELKNNCTTKWTTINGMGGYLFKSKINTEALFFLAAGWYSSNGFQGVDKDGSYWLRTYYNYRPSLAHVIAFRNMSSLMAAYFARQNGCSVRAVYVGQE